MTTPTSEQCGASARIQIGPMPYIGPCVLRHGHDGPVHQDAAGAQWTDPRPATAEDSAGLCPASLRDQITRALDTAICDPEASEFLADAVMPVIEAETAALRQRAETAERRVEHFEEYAVQVDADLGIETQRAEEAEAAVQRVREAERIHRVAHPSPVGGCPACHILAALDQPEETRE
ncbi:MAG TPA: hypothetical protein VFY14_16720 [Streptomyces sp.]|nr:hypothetical protein [Streptomyces sp.]